MELDTENPIPLYYQLKTIIEKRINSGELNPGDKISSENQLCEQYEVSRTTARQAITELVNSGKVVRTQGRGTFVAHQNPDHLIYRHIGFSADMKKQGFKPGSKLLDYRVIKPGLDIARMLQIKPSEAVIYLERLRYINGQIMGFEKTYLPFTLFNSLSKKDIEKGSLYKVLIDRFNTIPTRALMDFKAIRCDLEIHSLLEIQPDTPIFHMSILSYDQNDQLFEHALTYYRGDLYSFHAEITKNKQEDGILFKNSKSKNGKNKGE